MSTEQKYVDTIVSDQEPTPYFTDLKPVSEDGMYAIFWSNGNVRTEENYVNGIHNGPLKIWWKNGQIEYIAQMINDKPIGPVNHWYENGQQSISTYYDLDGNTGTHRQWKQDGSLWVETDMVKGKVHGKSKEVHDDGTFTVLSYNDGKHVGNSYKYGKNGHHIGWTLYDDNGNYVCYNPIHSDRPRDIPVH